MVKKKEKAVEKPTEKIKETVTTVEKSKSLKKHKFNILVEYNDSYSNSNNKFEKELIKLCKYVIKKKVILLSQEGEKEAIQYVAYFEEDDVKSKIKQYKKDLKLKVL